MSAIELAAVVALGVALSAALAYLVVSGAARRARRDHHRR